MKRTLTIAIAAAMLLAAPVSAQTEVGESVHSGLHWAVAAPRGASWTLNCRFTPVTSEGIMFNAINETGTGARQGRLPGDNARCTLTKTGGAGGVGISVVKNHQATVAGTADAATSARVNVF